MLAVLAWVGFFITGVTGAGLFLMRRWRWMLIALAVQYLGTSLLVAQHWPGGMAAAKLITGWMAVTLLGMAVGETEVDDADSESLWSNGVIFRGALVFLVWIVALILSGQVQAVIQGAALPVIAASLLLMGTGVLQLGTGSSTPRTVLGLLTALAGFEVLYASMEASLLVAGLLAVITMGIALVGGYLLTMTGPADEEDLL